VKICGPRKNWLLKFGNTGDLIDARKLAELLRNNSLSSVWHQFGEEFSESSEKPVAGEKKRSFSARSRRLSSSR